MPGRAERKASASSGTRTSGPATTTATTAQIYTDLGLFTANEEIVADVSELFNALTGYSRQVEYRALLVAPVALREQFTALVEREIAHAKAGVPAGIVIKNNSISDPEVIRLLYRASQAGVRIDAIVRGICCLRPGVPGSAILIRVRSIVGRFLEHSRIYSFENAGDPELYIGSADLMERNLDRRVEALCPVLDPDIRRYLRYQLFQAYLRDDTRATRARSRWPLRSHSRERPRIGGRPAVAAVPAATRDVTLVQSLRSSSVRRSTA